MTSGVISSSPHIRCGRTTKKIMIDVLIALLPASVAAVVYFGISALLIILIGTLSACLAEFVWRLCNKEKPREILNAFDYSSAVTGLLLALNLSSTVPLYLPLFGSVFAVIAVKMLFGGTGKNFVNPAIVGRIFLFMSFSSVMTAGYANPIIGIIGGGTIQTGETVLSQILVGGSSKIVHSGLDLFLGTGVSGCIGETCKAALLAGGIYLCARRVIKWQYPLIYIAATGLLSAALYGETAMIMYSVLSGGLFLGAIFMATDYVTSPNTALGNYIYFICLGVLTAVLRYAAQMETVSFAILLMNLTVPLIDKACKNVPFGSEKQKTAKAGKA